MSKKMRYTIYGVILAICFISVVVAIYDAVFLQKNVDMDRGEIELPNISNNEVIEEPIEEDTMETRIAKFKKIFENKIYEDEYDSSFVEKNDKAKGLVYTVAEINEKKDLYEVNIKIPLININDEVVKKFNMTTQEIFVERVNKAMQSSNEKTIINIDYVGYINGDVLSLVILGNIKEGNKSQRVIVQTYNYNMKTKKEVSAEELLKALQYDIKSVEDEIKREIEEVSKEAEILQQTGHPEAYGRNPEDKQYQVKNAENYFLGEHGEMYLIYAYGNQDETSEMDIIRFD